MLQPAAKQIQNITLQLAGQLNDMPEHIKKLFLLRRSNNRRVLVRFSDFPQVANYRIFKRRYRFVRHNKLASQWHIPL